MAFHFPAMPRIYMAMRQGRADALVEILKRTPEIPGSCQWCVFLRNHDELTLEMVTEEERQWMWKEYAPEARMRLNLGIRRRLAPLLDNDPRKIALAYSILFTLPGSPILYYGDEIGMGDNIQLPDRNGVRTPMQWTSVASAGFSKAAEEKFFAPVISNSVYGPQRVSVQAQAANPDSLYNLIRKMIAVRRLHPAFGQGKLTWLETVQNPAILVYHLQQAEESIYAIHNLSAIPQTVKLPAAVYQDLLADRQMIIADDALLRLEGLGYRWIKRLNVM